MKLAINATFNPSGGSKSQLVNMLKYFYQAKDIEIVIYIKRNNLSLVQDINQSNVKVIISKFAGINTGTRVIWEQTILPFLLLKDKIDILFCPGNIAPYFSPIKTVQWIGTIGPFHKDFYRHFSITEKIKLYINKIIMYKSAQQSDAVIFESNYTMRLFIDEYKVSAERSYVINIGKSKSFYPINQQEGITLSDKYDSFKSYALCVSHLYAYKNIPRMIEAFAIAKRITESDHKLLIAGNKKSNKYYNQSLSCT